VLAVQLAVQVAVLHFHVHICNYVAILKLCGIHEFVTLYYTHNNEVHAEFPQQKVRS
jgi:hypothetical protein